MNTVMNKLRRVTTPNSLLRDQRGLSTVEYTIILVLIAASAIGLWVSFGDSLTDKIEKSQQQFDKVQVEK